MPYYLATNPLERNSGYSLLEVLVILFVIGLLLSLGSVGLQTMNKRLQLDNARATLVQELNQARNNARYRSVDQTISWSVEENRIMIAGKILKFPHQIKLFQATGENLGSATFTAPFGRLEGDHPQFILRNLDGKTQTVSLVGVTGRVIVNEN